MTYDRPVVITPAVFPTRLVKAYSVSSLDDISAWWMVISHWRMSSTGDRGNCWNFSSIWRNYCTQHGRLASWPLLVCHLFLDSCSCKFLFKISAFILSSKWWTEDFYITFAQYSILCSVFRVLLPVMLYRNTPTNAWWVRDNGSTIQLHYYFLTLNNMLNIAPQRAYSLTAVWEAI